MKMFYHSRQISNRMLSTEEGRIFFIGLFILFLYVLELLLSCFLSFGNYQVLIAMTATHVLFGRAAGMAFGYAMNLGHSLVIPVSMLLESVMVMIFYPLVVFSIKRLVVIKVLGRFMKRIREVAEANKKSIKKYGVCGLLLFVWFPFWMTGPLAGAVLGFLMGMSSWLTLIIVLAGTYIAIFSWAFLLMGLHEKIVSYSSFAPMILVGIIILIAILGYLLQGSHYLEKNKNRK